VTRAKQLPVSAFAGAGWNGHRAHDMPQFAQSTERGGLSDLAAQPLTQLDGGQGALALQQLPGINGQRRDACIACGGGSSLWIALCLHRVEVGQRLRGGKEVRLLADDAGGRAEQVQRDDRARGHEPGQHLVRSREALRPGCGVGLAGDGLDEAGRGRLNVLVARQIEAQRRLREPALRVIQRQQRVAVLTPACQPRLLQLILSHELPIVFSLGRESAATGMCDKGRCYTR
jgi:hypothetical protein